MEPPFLVHGFSILPFCESRINPDKAGKLPPLAELKFDPATTWGKARSIPVPGGGGYWTWNFFVQKKDSLLSRIS